MINRTLIRIKVLQVLYAFYHNGNNSLKNTENEALFSLQKSYELYFYFLLLPIEITKLQAVLLDGRKHKYQPTEEDLNPNMKFVNNRFIQQLAANKELCKYTDANKISWINDKDFLRSLLDTIIATREYAEYMAAEEDSYSLDRNFWREIFKNHIYENEFVTEYLEDKSIYWNDDIDMVATYVMKTLRQIEESEGDTHELQPMFRDMEDRFFAVQLIRKSIMEGVDYREMIDRHTRNWAQERLADIDINIMQMALAELLSFPSIPINVTLNEYIELSRYYSTPNSPNFVNGILDAIVTELKKENRLFKE